MHRRRVRAAPPRGGGLATALVDLVMTTIELIGARLPRRLVAIYLGGSYARKSQTLNSDLDLHFVFSGRLGERDIEVLNELWGNISVLSFVQVDMTFHSLVELSRIGDIDLPSCKCIWGSDIRKRLPRIDFDDYLWRNMVAGVDSSIRIRQGKIECPLVRPRPRSRFLGYEDWYFRDAEGNWTQSGISWMTVVFRKVTAIVAFRTRLRSTSALQSLNLYEAHIGDQWSKYISSAYREIRVLGDYRLDSRNRESKLRLLALQTVEFENYFFDLFVGFLIGNFQSSHHYARHWAPEVLLGFRANSPEIIEALSRLTRDRAKSVRTNAAHALAVQLGRASPSRN